MTAPAVGLNLLLLYLNRVMQQLRRRSLGWSAHDGKPDDEGGSGGSRRRPRVVVVLVALHAHLTSQFLDESLGHRETQPGSSPGPWNRAKSCREEIRLVLRGYATAGILAPYDQILNCSWSSRGGGDGGGGG